MAAQARTQRNQWLMEKRTLTHTHTHANNIITKTPLSLCPLTLLHVLTLTLAVFLLLHVLALTRSVPFSAQRR